VTTLLHHIRNKPSQSLEPLETAFVARLKAHLDALASSLSITPDTLIEILVDNALTGLTEAQVAIVDILRAYIMVSRDVYGTYQAELAERAGSEPWDR